MEKINKISNERKSHMPIQDLPALSHIIHNFPFISKGFETFSEFAYIQ